MPVIEYADAHQGHLAYSTRAIPWAERKALAPRGQFIPSGARMDCVGHVELMRWHAAPTDEQADRLDAIHEARRTHEGAQHVGTFKFTPGEPSGSLLAMRHWDWSTTLVERGRIIWLKIDSMPGRNEPVIPIYNHMGFVVAPADGQAHPLASIGILDHHPPSWAAGSSPPDLVEWILRAIYSPESIAKGNHLRKLVRSRRSPHR